MTQQRLKEAKEKAEAELQELENNVSNISRSDRSAWLYRLDGTGTMRNARSKVKKTCVAQEVLDTDHYDSTRERSHP
ncbi:hypothetical protein ACLB1R_17385 [Escherichia coli]